MEHTKILGIDIGHGETAAVCMDVSNKKIIRLNLEDGQTKVIPTLVGFREDGSAVIGNAAGKSTEVKEVVAYFKKAPAYFSDMVRERPRSEYISLFAGKLIDQIFEYNKDILTTAEKDSLQLIVGCPSSSEWTGENEHRIYEDLLRSASGIRDTAVVPESRAALFSTFTDQGMKGTSAENGVLVFDFGSSTADCTYMCMGKMLMEYSWRLGASEIEELMIDELQKTLEKAAERENVHASFQNRDSILFSLRVDKKEKYYSKMLLEDESTFMRRASVLDDQGRQMLDSSGKPRKLKVEIEVDDALMDRLTRCAKFRISRGSEDTKVNDSWYNHCRSFLEQARDMVIQYGLPCQSVMLTGGASKMDFVQDLCREVFQDTTLIRSDEPSFSVALGLAWTGMVDHEIESRKAVVQEEIRGDINAAKAVCMNRVADQYEELMYDGFLKEVRKWGEDNQEKSLEELGSSFKNGCASPQVEARMAEIMQKETLVWAHNCAEIVQNAANRQGGEIFRKNLTVELKLQEDFADQFVRPEMDLSKIIGNVNIGGMLKKILRVSSILTFTALLSTILGPMALALLPFGWLDLQSDKNVKKPLDKKERARAVEQLANDRSTRKKLRKDINTTLEESMNASRSQIMAGMTDRAMDILALRWFEQTKYL